MSNRTLLMIMAFLLCPVLTAQATSFHAVCVGISDYPGTGDDLPADCVNDATDMRIYLMNYQGWSSSNILLSTNSYATKSNITSYIGAMPNSTGNSELFFYSGHGTTSGLYTYTGTITPSELQSAFGGRFNQYCCFLNACHSGIFVSQMSKGEISSAVTSNEYAYTGGPDDNCIYSYYVLEGIKDDQADPESGHVVSAKEVHDYAAPRTTEYAAQYGLSMHPQFRGNLGVLNLAPLGPTTSGTLIDSELWDQNVTLTGNVTVPSVITLAINSGITVNLTGSYKLQVNGTLTILGSSGQLVTINGQNYPRTGYSNAMIDIKDGATANIEYTDFINSPYDLIIRNSANATVHHCTFTNFGFDSNSRAITAYNSTGPVTISNCTFTGSGQYGYGVYATNTGTNVTISNNTFTACRVGIRCYASNAFITSNTIQNGYYYGIQSDNVATSAQYRDNTICNNG